MSDTVSIVEYPGKRLAGIAARSSLAAAAEVCPALWEQFMTPVAALAGAHVYDAYGVSTNFADDGSFTYWATVDAPMEHLSNVIDVANIAPSYTPFRIDGLATIDLPAGLYAKATAHSFAMPPSIFGFLHRDWPKTQEEYVVDVAAPCFEYYPATWRAGKPFDFYVPVVKKN